MTTPFVCVLIAFVLIYVPKLPLSVAMARQPGGYDNKDPRSQQAKLTGKDARARGAHYNGFEAFSPFAAAVFVAHLGGAGADHRASILAIAFVVVRVLYIAVYLADLASVRSAIWSLGFLCTVALFCLPWL
jgi:uncharacterized MAPEG superfamily protein